MISVRNVTLRRGVNVVLDNASVTFTPGTTSGGLSTSTTATNVLATALYP